MDIDNEVAALCSAATAADRARRTFNLVNRCAEILGPDWAKGFDGDVAFQYTNSGHAVVHIGQTSFTEHADGAIIVYEEVAGNVDAIVYEPNGTMYTHRIDLGDVA